MNQTMGRKHTEGRKGEEEEIKEGGVVRDRKVV